MRVVAFVSPAFRALEALNAVAVHDEESLRREIVDADVLVLAPRYGEMLRSVLGGARRLRWIHSLGAGVETLPFDLLRKTDVIVTNSRGIYADGLAEFAIAAMLSFAKDFRRLVQNQAERKWEPFTVQRLEGATAGIIGFGSIGRAIGSRAEALGMRVLTSRRTQGMPIDDVIAASDYVVISAPLTEETRGLMSRDRIALMRPSAVLVNVSRGAIVDEAALTSTLSEGRIRGAALDVFEVEPLPQVSPLWSLQNVLISPHSADRTSDSHDRAAALFARNLECFRTDQPLENPVDKLAGY